jgi:Domain of unknown function (DUF929)
MVDWDAVERLRSKGWDWDRIAGDPKVGFHADSDVGDPGRALRTLYYQRRSKAQRRPSKGAGKEGASDDVADKPRWNLARIGYIIVPLFAIWFVLAYFLPSPVGTYFPAIPWLGLLLAGSGFVLVWGLLRTTERWSKVMRTSVITGIVLGLVFTGGIALIAIEAGCPTLPPVSGAEPQGWEKANAAPWKTNGAPVFFFAGSIACPYCSASSWAMLMAMQRFASVSGSTVTGTYLGASNPNDNPRSIPEVVLASASVQSPYVAFNVLEGLNDNGISIPPATACIQQAYISAYDAGLSIPFVVIGGVYIHVGTLVAPTSLQGLTPQQVQGQLSNQSEPSWSAISPAAFMMEAYLVKANGGQPHSIATDANVAPLLAQIT